MSSKDLYWKLNNCNYVYWCKDKNNICKEIKFNTPDEYFQHREKNGYPKNWSNIRIINNFIENEDIRNEDIRNEDIRNEDIQNENIRNEKEIQNELIKNLESNNLQIKIHILDNEKDKMNQFVKLLFLDLTGAFRRINIKIIENSKYEIINENFINLVFIDNNISNETINKLKNLKNTIFYGWCCHGNPIQKNILDNLLFIYMTCYTKTPVGKQYFLVNNEKKYCPLYHRVNENPDLVGSFKRIIKYDWCYMGAPYRNDLKPNNLKNYNLATFNSKYYLNCEERKNIYLSSIFHLAYQGDTNIRDGHVSQRVFEGMAYGCIVLTNSKPACEQCNNIPIYVNTLKDVEDKIAYYKNNPDEISKKQKLAYQFVKEFGTNTFSINELNKKTKMLYNVDFLKITNLNNLNNLKNDIVINKEKPNYKILFGLEDKFIDITDKIKDSIFFLEKHNRFIICGDPFSKHVWLRPGTDRKGYDSYIISLLNIRDPYPGVLKNIIVKGIDFEYSFKANIYTEIDSDNGIKIKEENYLNFSLKKLLETYNNKYLNDKLHPIIFSFPFTKIIDKLKPKKRILSHMDPDNKSTYIYNNESDYYLQYQESMFAITHKKLGWDCMRHYEVMANGCIPIFHNIQKCPKLTLFNFPKDMIKKGNHLYDKLKTKKFIDLNKEDIDEYNDLANNMLMYTRKNLASINICKYILEKSNNDNIQNILILSGNNNCDYLRDMIIIGFKNLLGKNCIEYPKIEFLYKDFDINSRKLYGRGFSYTNVIDNECYDNSILNFENNQDKNKQNKIIENLIKTKAYDIILYGSLHRGKPFYDLVKNVYEPNKVIFLCGEDCHNCNLCINILNSGHYMFIRELDYY